jgi:hypothetical protein
MAFSFCNVLFETTSLSHLVSELQEPESLNFNILCQMKDSCFTSSAQTSEDNNNNRWVLMGVAAEYQFVLSPFHRALHGRSLRVLTLQNH